MAEVTTENEPSIEEILESIRQIISDDDDEGGTDAAAAADAPPAAESAAADDGDILDLVDRVDEDPPAPDDGEEPEVDEVIEEVVTVDVAADVTPDTGGAQTEAGLLSDEAAGLAAASMSKLLSGNVAVQKHVPGKVGSVTLEEMVLDLMRPLVKEWLDQNLPALVEKKVEEELARIAKRNG